MLDKTLSTSFFPCSATAHQVNQPKSVVASTPEFARKAALTVAANSLGVEDCERLLDMLGLLRLDEEVPS